MYKICRLQLFELSFYEGSFLNNLTTYCIYKPIDFQNTGKLFEVDIFKFIIIFSDAF